MSEQQQQPEKPTSPAVQQFLQAVSDTVRQLGIQDAIFGVVDPTTGAVRVIHTKDIEKHAEVSAENRYELRRQIAAKLDLSDPAVLSIGGFGASFR